MSRNCRCSIPLMPRRRWGRPRTSAAAAPLPSWWRTPCSRGPRCWPAARAWTSRASSTRPRYGRARQAIRYPRTEPFGPVALLIPVQDADEALHEANSLPFGLAAYAFTNNMQLAHRFANEIESGVVCINELQASLPETPFGGYKDSGLGSEGGTEGLREFLKVKCVRQGGLVHERQTHPRFHRRGRDGHGHVPQSGAEVSAARCWATDLTPTTCVRWPATA